MNQSNAYAIDQGAAGFSLRECSPRRSSRPQLIARIPMLHSFIIIAATAMFVTTGCGPSFNLYRTRGIELLQQGRFAAAKGLFLEAHAMVPENVENLCDLAHCHMGIGRDYMLREDRRAASREFDWAITYYRRAQQSFPGHQRAIAGLNDALEHRGKYAEALETAEWASKVVGPSIRQQLFLAKEYAERGDADKALLTYKQAVAMEPANPTPYWALGLFYIEIGRLDDGIAKIQQAYRLDPAQTAIADHLRRLGAEVPKVDLINQSG